MFKNLGTYFKNNKNIKTKTKIEKYFFNSKWIILQAVNFDEDVYGKNIFSILIDKYNYQKIIDMIPKRQRVIVVGNKNMIAIMCRYCQSCDLQVYAHFTN